MKLLPMLLLNLATVVVALVVYDQMRGEAPATSAGIGGASVELGSRAPESMPRPALQAAGTDPRILARLDALEAAVRERAPTATGDADETDGTARAHDVPASPAPTEEPSAEDVRWFLRLQKAVKHAERIERNAWRVDRALGTLPLRLSKQQREKIHAAYASFQPRIGRIWSEANIRAKETIAAGRQLDRAEMKANTTRIIQGAFAESLSGVVAPVDAESIATALLPGGK